MKASVLKDILARSDQEVRAGRSNAVRNLLAPIVIARVPRDFRLPLARICRRAGLWAAGLRLLSPVLYPKHQSQERATPQEQAEYGALLMKIGSLREASALLNKVNSHAAPEALLFRAFCLFAEWNYLSAIPVLEEYLASGLSADAELIAKVNLGSALIENGDLDSAEQLLKKNIRSSKGYPRVLANNWQLLGQVYCLRGEFQNSRRALETSCSHFDQDRTVDQLFVQKWLSVLSATEENDPTPLMQFRARAFAEQHWESVRDCDYYRLQLNFADRDFLELYFGTPHRGFREKLRRNFPEVRIPPYWEIGKGPVFDVDSGTWNEQEEPAPLHVHLLLAALASDHYRPLSFGGVFAALFPADRFDIYSSPNRVHQNLWRTRGWLRRVGMPADVKHASGAFRLLRLQPMTLRLKEVARAPDEVFAREEIPTDGFSAQDIRKILKVSRATAQRLVKTGVEKGRLVRLGSGKNTKYRRVS